MKANTQNPATSLARRLGPWTGMAVVIGVTIGSGIFRVPATIAADTGSLTGVALVWILGGTISLCGALSVAELAAMYPAAGGPYVYLREAFGRPLAFLFGWMSLLTIPFSWAAQALTFANYFGTVVSLGSLATHLVAALLITLLCAIQYRSVGLGAVVQNVSTGAKLLALAGLAITLFAFAPHVSTTLASAGNGEVRWSGILIALVAALWAYDGWANLTTLSGEIREPARNLPRALIGGTLLTLAIYLIVNAAFAVALPFPALSASASVAADAVTAVLGQGGAAVVAALVMVSTFGSLNGSILSDSRIFYAMAEDGLFFKSVGRIHPRFGTPHVAILFTSLLAVVYVLSRDFLQLAEAYILGTWPFLALCVIGLFMLRRRQAALTRPYKALGYPFIPILFVLGTFTVIGFTLYKQPLTTGLNFAVILLGLPLYWLWVQLRKRS